ncbi:TIGR03862 family flavoprotein [Pusillimonas minor]|uniref:TIGR03862 family flavoprotein n=1 Tax=Pusillimonas minor TaxID=2697024 RepID=A0A842HPL0_9BURK|nr:TIGR03862 family flavoprotein [Pusillimonas minor]MBC2770146.1 TIGR03862 family flavoprotein [Pusillimonas minor]
MPYPLSFDVAIIGAGPSGLMAAEVISAAGLSVAVFEAKPSLGRKFLRAGVGGLNLTHAEAYEQFCSRYGDRQRWLQPMLDAFTPTDVRHWAQGLGIETFEGSSGKVFPVQMKAAPLLRAWSQRLHEGGVKFMLRHRWQGWVDDALRFTTPSGEVYVKPRATVLALGGGSWPQLGADAAWVPWLQEKEVVIAPLQSANCGFNVSWTPHLRTKFAGAQLKAVALTFTDALGTTHTRRGEFVVSETGVEGNLIYALSASLRDMIVQEGAVTVYADLAPDRSTEALFNELARPRGSRSLSSHLQSRVGITGIKSALLYEVLDKSSLADPMQLAQAVKALPIRLLSPRPIAEAISTAGGVVADAVDDTLMLKAMPGVFAAGEMLDWEAPTGGYLLTACLAQGVWAGNGVCAWLKAERPA